MRCSLTVSFLVVLAAFAYGCSPTPKADDIPGTYSLVFQGKRDEIRLGSDGHYVHRYIPREGPVITETGLWSFQQNPEATRIVLNDFTDRVLAPIHEREPARGAWVPLVERKNSGRIRLVLSEDDDLYYDKADFVNAEFTKKAPIGIAGGLNVYRFACGDAVNYSDP